MLPQINEYDFLENNTSCGWIWYGLDKLISYCCNTLLFGILSNLSYYKSKTKKLKCN